MRSGTVRGRGGATLQARGGRDLRAEAEAARPPGPRPFGWARCGDATSRRSYDELHAKGLSPDHDPERARPAASDLTGAPVAREDDRREPLARLELPAGEKARDRVAARWRRRQLLAAIPRAVRPCLMGPALYARPPSRRAPRARVGDVDLGAGRVRVSRALDDKQPARRTEDARPAARRSDHPALRDRLTELRACPEHGQRPWVALVWGPFARRARRAAPTRSGPRPRSADHAARVRALRDQRVGLAGLNVKVVSSMAGSRSASRSPSTATATSLEPRRRPGAADAYVALPTRGPDPAARMTRCLPESPPNAAPSGRISTDSHGLDGDLGSVAGRNPAPWSRIWLYHAAWARHDSNVRPRGSKPRALSPELRTRRAQRSGAAVRRATCRPDVASPARRPVRATGGLHRKGRGHGYRHAR